MKKECEQLFIDLVSPYLTALSAARSSKSDNWHAVFNYATVLQKELEDPFPGADIKVFISDSKQFNEDLSRIRGGATNLAGIASKQVQAVEAGVKPDANLFNEAMLLLLSIQKELRTVIVDNVCACESGPKVLHYEVGVFPKQDKSLLTLRGLAGGYKIEQVHDDGDLTVEANGTLYVVTTDGGFFEDQKSCHGK